MARLKKVFYIFLDISGILLGIFLTGLGLWVVSGHQVSRIVGGIVLILGVGAFLIHFGHYFNLRYIRWMFGSQYFLTRSNKSDDGKG